MTPAIKTAIIGFGVSGRCFHAPFLHISPKYELAAIVERHGEESKKQYPAVRLCRTADEVMDDPDIDLIVITTPNESHLPLAQQALLAGKHVVLEKPFTIHSGDALQLIALAGSQRRIISPYQNRRYVSDYRTVGEIVQRKLLGDIVECEIHYDRYRPELRPGAWREKDIPGSGILYDLGAHLIDQALYLFGPPQTITADVRRQRPGIVTDDYFDIRLDYGWLRVILEAGMMVRERGPRYMLHGVKGSFIKSGDDPQEALLRAGVMPDLPDWGTEPEEIWGLLHTEENGKIIREKYPSATGNFGAYYDDLYDAIINGFPLKVRPEDGYNIIKMIELALQSSREKRTVACEGLKW